MADQTPRLIVAHQGPVTVVELMDPKVLDEMGIMRIGDEISALIAESDDPKIVMDFINVGHMSSSVLRMLITLQKRALERGGCLRLCNICASIYEVFVITRLNKIFEIYGTRAEAVKPAAPDRRGAPGLGADTVRTVVVVLLVLLGVSVLINIIQAVR